ncbi:TetR/AcrR family transcriptional regulator [Tenuifilum osseticum]|uniref:TetR/AcrR family transcriptional regulator n=2 Tax=Tenuifilum TaxID=2760873 RepID=UPI0034E58DFA
MISKKIEKDTESKILEAAKRVFVQKGLDGARMQEIADEARINKALLHYYFRSKEKLFMTIFKVELNNFFPRLIPVLLSKEMTYEQKIRHFVEEYIELFLRNPFLPAFVLREANRNPEMIAQFITESGINAEKLKDVMKVLSHELGLSVNEVLHLMVTTVSSCIFPFAGKPIIEQVLFNGNEGDYQKFLSERKRYVADFMIYFLKGRLK